MTDDLTYIAGPMTGYPEWNHPAFYHMAARVRSAGYRVICPAELHTPDQSVPWDHYLRRDLTELVKCQRILLLPGWYSSRGASLERKVAHALGMEIIEPYMIEAFIAEGKGFSA